MGREGERLARGGVARDDDLRPFARWAYHLLGSTPLTTSPRWQAPEVGARLHTEPRRQLRVEAGPAARPPQARRP